jgi:hypothetical protein
MGINLELTSPAFNRTRSEKRSKKLLSNRPGFTNYTRKCTKLVLGQTVFAPSVSMYVHAEQNQLATEEPNEV